MKGVIALAAAILVATPAHTRPHHSAHVTHGHSAKQIATDRAKRARIARERIELENVKSALYGSTLQYDELALYLYGWQRLVPLPNNQFVVVDTSQIQPPYRFCTPDARLFLLALGRDFYRKFHHPIKVNSAIRTREHQAEIKKHNLNAIEASGPAATLHMRANTVDLAYLHYLSAPEQNFVEGWLNRQRERDNIDYQKEKLSQKMYHVVVYRFSGQPAQSSAQSN